MVYPQAEINNEMQ